LLNLSLFEKKLNCTLLIFNATYIVNLIKECKQMIQSIKNVVNKVKNSISLLNNNYRPVRKKNLRYGVFSPKYAEVGSTFKKRNDNLQINQRSCPLSLSIQGQPLQIKIVKERRAKLAQCKTIALNAPKIALPTGCVADKGYNLVLFIISALGANPNSTNDTITVLKLVDHVKNNKYNRNHIAYKFRKYTLDDFIGFRMFTKSWLQQVEVPGRALDKALSDYGSSNASEHKEYFKKIGLNKKK